MSKGLEALERLHEFAWSNEEYRNDIDNTDYQIIEKELKALEIIKKVCSNFPITIREMIFKSELPKEEYDLLKEVLL